MNYLTCILVKDKSQKVLKIEWTLANIYKYLNCQTIDIITRYIGNDRFNIVVDDEGALKSNNILTGLELNGNEHLMGNILIVGLVDQNGDNTNLTENDILNINKRIFSNILFYSFEREDAYAK